MQKRPLALRLTKMMPAKRQLATQLRPIMLVAPMMKLLPPLIVVTTPRHYRKVGRLPTIVLLQIRHLLLTMVRIRQSRTHPMIHLVNKARILKSKIQRLKTKLVGEMARKAAPKLTTAVKLTTQVRLQMVAKTVVRVIKSRKLILSSRRVSKHVSLHVASSAKVSHLTRRMPASTYASTSALLPSNS